VNAGSIQVRGHTSNEPRLRRAARPPRGARLFFRADRSARTRTVTPLLPLFRGGGSKFARGHRPLNSPGATRHFFLSVPASRRSLMTHVVAWSAIPRGPPQQRAPLNAKSIVLDRCNSINEGRVGYPPIKEVGSGLKRREEERECGSLCRHTYAVMIARHKPIASARVGGGRGGSRSITAYTWFANSQRERKGRVGLPGDSKDGWPIRALTLRREEAGYLYGSRTIRFHAGKSRRLGHRARSGSVLRVTRGT